jgi:prolyl-tRNA synthetase
LSNIWVNRTNITNNEPTKDEDGHGLLQRAGFLAPSASGFFHLLPLGLRVQDRLVKLIDKHMSSIGAARLALSSVCDQKLWQQSGRLQGSLKDGKHELMGVLDRKQSGFLLSPTHEESISTLVKPYIQSYRDLPLRLYQVTAKYRDELRPRQGLLRTKEFLMKDLYTFDATLEEALETYAQVRTAYDNLFKELDIPYLTAEADSGNIGGNLNHEYHYASPLGEDTVWTCDSCTYTANDEVVPTTTNSKDTMSVTHECPRCTTGTIAPIRTIEVGHTFHLGTRYSKPLDLSFHSEDPSVSSVAQMGCHGIGVSRLVGTIANVLAAPTGRKAPAIGLRWPRGLAPFDVLIVSDNEKGTDLYDTLVDEDGPRVSSIDAVIDDRPQDISWKLKRADLVGYPVVIVLGKKYKAEGKLEVFCRKSGDTMFVNEEDMKHTVLQMLKGSS